MSRFPSRMLGTLLLTAGLFLQSCSLAPVTPPDYYILPSSEGQLTNRTKFDGIRVSVGPLSLPGYLQKSSISLRDPHSNQLYVTDKAVWGEPLEDGITRVLCTSISNSLTSVGGVAVPLRSNFDTPLRVYLVITKFDGDLGSAVTLDADWGVATSHGRILRMGHFTQHADAGSTFDTMVAAQGQLLERLGKQISQALLQMPQTDHSALQR